MALWRFSPSRTNDGISLNKYFNALESLQTNTTLKTLRLHPKVDSISDNGKIKHLVSLVKKTTGWNIWTKVCLRTI
jgi:hypothetical protein